MKKRLLALGLALLLTAQLILPAAAETIGTEPTESTAAETTVPETTEATEPAETKEPAETTEPTETMGEPEPTEGTVEASEEPTVDEEEEAPEDPAEEDAQDAEDEETADDSGTCGDNLTWKLVDGTLTISGTGAMWDYSWGTAPWYGLGIDKLVLEEGITSVGDYAFIGTWLGNGTLELPDSLCSLGICAFQSINSHSLTIGPNLTSIGYDALTRNFWSEINLSEENQAFVYQNGGLYTSDMTRLVTIYRNYEGIFDLPETVISIDDNVFGDAHNITEIKFGSSFRGFRTEGFHFMGCSALTCFTVSQGNTAFSSKDGVLFSADGRTLAAYPMGKTDSVYEIPSGTRKIETGAIFGCQYLEELVIPSGIAALGWGIQNCDQLRKVTIPATVQKIEEKSIGYSSGEKIEGFVIRGVSGSRAESYAIANGFTFETIPDSGSDENSCGENLIWKVEDGVLTISGTGEMDDYTMTDEPIDPANAWLCYSSAPWGKETLKKVILEDGVTSIGQYAFVGQEQLNELVLPGSLESIGEEAFESCWNLKKLRLPEGVKRIEDGAFSNVSLEELYIPASLTELGTRVFEGYNLSKMEVAPGNPRFQVRDNGLYADDFTKLWIQKWSGSTAVIPDTVKSVDSGVLSGLFGVSILVVGAQCDLREVLDYYLLGSMPSLKEIRVSEGNPYHTAKDGVLFTKNGSTLEVYPYSREGSIYQVPEGTRSIAANAIFGAPELRTVLLPKTVKSLGWDAISAPNIQQIYIPASVTSMREQCVGYYNGQKLPDFRISGVPGSAAETYANENGFEFVPVEQTIFTVRYDANGGKGVPVEQQRNIGTVLTLSGQIPTRSGYTFLGWDDNASATMPKYKAGGLFAEDRDVTLYAVWFEGDVVDSGICGNNLAWYLDKAGTLTISGTGRMFDYQAYPEESRAPWSKLGIKKLVLSEGITHIGNHAFYECRTLDDTLKLPSTLESIGIGAFGGCESLHGELILPEGLQSIGDYAFRFTRFSDILVIPDSIKEIPYNVFGNCEQLTTIYIGTNVQHIGMYAFLMYYGTSRRLLYAGSREQWEAITDSDAVSEGTTIHYNARRPLTSESGTCGDGLSWTYADGTLTISGSGSMDAYTEESPAPWDSYGMEITGIRIEEGVTAIGARAFWDCARLQSISLPGSAVEIGDGATLNCRSLASVIYAGSQSDFRKISVGTDNEAFQNASVEFGDKTYRITYHNIDNGDNNPNSVFGTDEKDLVLAAAQREGYTFGGWFSDAALTKKVTKIAKTNTADVELWAKWTINSYVLVFNANASGVTGKMPKVNGVTDQMITLPSNTFRRTGYTFKGWNMSAKPTEEEWNFADGDSCGFTPQKDKMTFTLYAQWEPNRYTVAFDANGGSGNMDSSNAVYDTALTLPGNTFRKPGYVFNGWNTQEDGKGKTYKEGASVKNLAAEGTVTLYAMWKAGTYTVQFNGNGGTGSMKNQTIVYGKAVKLTGSAFKRTGYLFSGWMDTDGNTYTDKQSVTSLIPEGTLELTAQWTPITYTVVFKANGAEGTMADLPMTYDVTAEQPVLGFARANYRFEGWATSAGGKVVYGKGQPLSNLTAKAGTVVTLYAKWAPYSYTVRFDGSNATKGTMKDVTVLCGKTLNLSGNAFARTGYAFAGWTTQPGGTIVEYANKQKGLSLSDTDQDVVILYAVWMPVDYKVTYKNTTKGEAEALPAVYNIECADALADPGARPGCEFEGWYLDAKFKNPFTDFLGRTGNLTLYAKWSGTAVSYLIRFAPGEGTVTGKMADMTKRLCGKDYTLTGNAFKRTGYTFAGWAMGDLFLANKAVVSDLPVWVEGYVSDTPIVLTAQWTPTAYKITYKNLTAAELELVPQSYDIEHPAELPQLTREGFNFGGWFLDSACKKPAETVSGTGARTIYAKWTAHTYTVSFDGNGAAKGTMKSQSMTCGTAKALTGNAYSRTGYIFLGWALDKDAVEPDFKNKEKVLNLTCENGQTVTLYAVWKAK